MSQQDPGQHFDFEQINADAVCEKCGTVHAEPTLMCRTCGNNLREQRHRRIQIEPGMEAALGQGPGRFRVFTTVLTVLGILVILAAVINIGDIEAWLVGRQIEEDTGALGNVWSGPGSELYQELSVQLAEQPITLAEERDAIDNPVVDASYNGRYVISRPNALSQNNEVIGYALLSRRSNRVYFVARLTQGNVEMRGFATIDANENGVVRPVAMNSASVNIAGTEFRAWGYAVGNPDGSHTVYAQSARDNSTHGVFAHRVR